MSLVDKHFKITLILLMNVKYYTFVLVKNLITLTILKCCEFQLTSFSGQKSASSMERDCMLYVFIVSRDKKFTSNKQGSINAYTKQFIFVIRHCLRFVFITYCNIVQNKINIFYNQDVITLYNNYARYSRNNNVLFLKL